MNKVRNWVFAIIGIIAFALAGQIGKEVGGKASKALLSGTSRSEESRPWFNGFYHGITLETPAQLEQMEVTPPAGSEEYLNSYKVYSSTEGGIVVFVMYMDTKFDEYDVRVGLEGAVTNVIHTMNGQNLRLTFTETGNDRVDLVCDGTFTFRNSGAIVKGYAYWNEESKVAMVMSIGENDTSSIQKTARVMQNIRLAF